MIAFTALLLVLTPFLCRNVVSLNSSSSTSAPVRSSTTGKGTCLNPDYSSSSDCDGNCTAKETCHGIGYGCFDCVPNENKTTTPFVVVTVKPTAASAIDRSSFIGLVVGCVLGTIALIAIASIVAIVIRKRQMRNGVETEHINRPQSALPVYGPPFLPQSR